MDFKHTILSVIGEILQTILVSLAIFLFVYVFLVQPHRVKGESMLPNFYDGELLLTEKVTYRLYKPDRGDVIVFRAPSSQNVDFIKRVIGLPGEKIRIEDGSVFINGEKLAEPYETQPTTGTVEVAIGNDQYFVLGDNRNASSDSRSFGPISKDSIRGRTWLVYWPLWKSVKSDGLRIVSKVSYSILDLR
ncbi:signal peptidase I [Candidatus Curtissbacteria bacterium RIFCSPHIGHO2_01_FULL_41_11]|uniref:Signal peptidase I n=1 Tax=Candidatus Curtissbacteria bacterium RIFCSPHIGHO2_01_FULL_41_11 TaxID=1797711 RepID=A0A1F5G6Y3_9BACT|nr:MAG: signal peptidase I [Candidatus Curtissbacteria bacterium RIFCSPHIGHO2_01_FULL_41_11]